MAGHASPSVSTLFRAPEGVQTANGGMLSAMRGGLASDAKRPPRGPCVGVCLLAVVPALIAWPRLTGHALADIGLIPGA